MSAKIVTYTGKSFDLVNPQPEMVCIEDIAHSLAYICRYTGHVRDFYSVAQHCVLMARGDLPGEPIQRLLHDAAETYIGDIARPWKRLLMVQLVPFPDQYVEKIKNFERKIQKVIGLALGINLEDSAEIEEADHRMMATEIRDLMPDSDDYGIHGIEPLADRIHPWGPKTAEHAFLSLDSKLREAL